MEEQKKAAEQGGLSRKTEQELYYEERNKELELKVKELEKKNKVLVEDKNEAAQEWRRRGDEFKERLARLEREIINGNEEKIMAYEEIKKMKTDNVKKQGIIEELMHKMELEEQKKRQSEREALENEELKRQMREFSKSLEGKKTESSNDTELREELNGKIKKIVELEARQEQHEQRVKKL